MDKKEKNRIETGPGQEMMKILCHLKLGEKTSPGTRAVKQKKESLKSDGKFKRRITWAAAMGGTAVMLFIIAGIYLTISFFGNWLAGMGIGLTPAKDSYLADTGYRTDMDMYRSEEWQEGDAIDRMRIREMIEAEQIAVKKVKAARSVSERDIELKSTGFDEHRVPYAVMTVRDGQKKTYHVGDRISDAEIMGIFPDQVVLDLEGRRFTLSVESAGSSRASGQEEPRVEYIGDSNPMAMPTETSKENRRRLAGETRMKRADKGYTIVTLDGHSPLGYTGIEKGDTILEINGITLDSRKGTILAYESLGRDRSVPIVFMRNGITMTAAADVP